MSLVGREPPIAAHKSKVCFQGPCPQVYKADFQITESNSWFRPTTDLHQKLINPARASLGRVVERAFSFFQEATLLRCRL